MAENNNYKTITRIIEYYGPVEWLESTMANSRIPIQGTMQMRNGVYIKSGVIKWQPDEVIEGQVEEGDKSPSEQPVEVVKTVPFKRPGVE